MTIEYRPADGWRVVTDDGEAGYYRCRAGASRWHTACGRPSVAAVLRSHGERQQEWHYCHEHLAAYGNKIVDGVVVRPADYEEPT